MITIEKLREYGANVEEGLARCMNNEALYLRLVGMVPGDQNFTALKEAANTGDTRRVFEAAHAIKGALGNLSLTPLYEKASEITELARAGADAPYQSLAEELEAMRDALSGLIEE